MGHYDCKSCDATPYEEHSPDCERFGTKSPPPEGTDMNQIEKVARAICIAEGYSPLELGEHYYALAKAAIAAMPVQAEPQWQGIESAPVWQEVLVYQKEASKRKSNKTGVITAVLMENGEWTLGAGGRRVANFLRPSPTHWMPLPTPPAGGSDAE